VGCVSSYNGFHCIQSRCFALDFVGVFNTFVYCVWLCILYLVRRVQPILFAGICGLFQVGFDTLFKSCVY